MKATITALLFSLTFLLNAQTEKYISDLPFSGLTQLDSIAKNYSVFFTGENHTYAKENCNIELEMLRYLNNQVGLQHFIIELGFSRGYILNAYINNDTSYYYSLRRTTAYNYMAFYQALRTYNMSLPIEKRIQVHGVDIERFTDDGPILLDKLLPPDSVPVPKVLEFQIEVIKSFAYYATNKYYSEMDREGEDYDRYYGTSHFRDQPTIDTILSNYAQNKSDYKNYLDSNFTVFDKVMQSLVELRKWQEYYRMPHQSIYRERKIYENVTALLQQYPEGKFYGQFGRCHTGFDVDYNCKWSNINSTALRLHEGSAKGKTLNIGIFYNTERNRLSSYEYFEVELLKHMPSQCSNTNTLIKVPSTDSALSKHFPFILYNNPCNKTKGNRYGDDAYDEDIFEWATLLDFAYGQSFYNFDQLNRGLQLGGNGFKSMVQSISFGYTYTDFGNYNIGRYDQHLTQKININNLHYTLSGFDLMEGYGYQPHIGNRAAIGIYGIVAYSRMALLVEDDSAKMVAVNGFSPIKKYQFTNDAVSAGVGIDLRVALSHTFGFFARGRYLVDFSKKYWNISSAGLGVMDSNSPQFSHTNANLQIGLSINVAPK
jgi:hypothetical protein